MRLHAPACERAFQCHLQLCGQALRSAVTVGSTGHVHWAAQRVCAAAPALRCHRRGMAGSQLLPQESRQGLHNCEASPACAGTRPAGSLRDWPCPAAARPAPVHSGWPAQNLCSAQQLYTSVTCAGLPAAPPGSSAASRPADAARPALMAGRCSSAAMSGPRLAAQLDQDSAPRSRESAGLRPLVAASRCIGRRRILLPPRPGGASGSARASAALFLAIVGASSAPCGLYMLI